MESYYRAQAVICASQAATSALLNVVARCSRAEAARLGMPEQVARHAHDSQACMSSGAVEAVPAIG